MTTWIIGTISPHAVYFFIVPLLKCCKRKIASKKFLQVEMNDALFGAEFQYAAK